MKTNMSNTDRATRIFLAVLVTALYFGGLITGTLATVLLIIAGVFLLTGFVGTCPLYSLFGLGTYHRTHEHNGSVH